MLLLEFESVVFGEDNKPSIVPTIIDILEVKVWEGSYVDVGEEVRPCITVRKEDFEYGRPILIEFEKFKTLYQSATGNIITSAEEYLKTVGL